MAIAFVHLLINHGCGQQKIHINNQQRWAENDISNIQATDITDITHIFRQLPIYQFYNFRYLSIPIFKTEIFADTILLTHPHVNQEKKGRIQNTKNLFVKDSQHSTTIGLRTDIFAKTTREPQLPNAQAAANAQCVQEEHEKH
eukprot:TRINITY_DN104053_c0_g1_i1.p2 TRINITY_DN104053_c0_g1~~TRINITY_DN104053_c0_g1_i1.p2  ORF type:complete len:151 (-),score=0.40 TRINITY_DN104053_c0_g1_i1:45-473(-)